MLIAYEITITFFF